MILSLGNNTTAIEEKIDPAAKRYKPFCGVKAKPREDDLKKTIDKAAIKTSAIDHFETNCTKFRKSRLFGDRGSVMVDSTLKRGKMIEKIIIMNPRKTSPF